MLSTFRKEFYYFFLKCLFYVEVRKKYMYEVFVFYKHYSFCLIAQLPAVAQTESTQTILIFLTVHHYFFILFQDSLI